MNAYLRGLPSRCQHIRLTIDRLFPDFIRLVRLAGVNVKIY